jgi:protein app1|nr:MAG TPA: Huntingtin protein-like protein [Caudoviricetes sp.]
MIRITFEAKNYISLCEELKLFLSYSNIPTTKEPPTAPVVPATVQAPPVAPVAQPTPAAPVVPTSVSVPTTPEPQPAPPAPPTPAVPVAPVKEYTLEEIQVALQPLMDAGRTNEIVGLMQKYKVASLPELPKDQFPNLVVDLRNMGARI